MSKLSDFVNSSAQDKTKTASFDNQQKSTVATEQDLMNLYNKYKDMDAGSLNSTLLSEVARQKSNGTFDYQKLESMLEGMKDALGETNYQNMKRILESLK